MANAAQPLILFILKKFMDSSGVSQISSGLFNSAGFVVDMLLAQGYRAKLVQAIDGNSVDGLVAQYKPAQVVIEAIWVSPSKMAQLVKLWPKIKWTVRVHSEIPFLANEGAAISWLVQYAQMGVQVGFNSVQTVSDFSVIAASAYLPNYYPLRLPRPLAPVGPSFDVGCFGAIRPFKNQLEQGFGAIQYAKAQKKKLVFHINDSRVEQMGANNLKNLQALFAAAGYALKVEPWSDHQDFLELLATMDVCLQVSMSESFCIVAADAASMGVPLVGSAAIPWLPRRSQADPSDAASIAEAMTLADATSVAMNRAALDDYLSGAIAAWRAWMV